LETFDHHPIDTYPLGLSGSYPQMEFTLGAQTCRPKKMKAAVRGKGQNLESCR
jgi:hypothetical protein